MVRNVPLWREILIMEEAMHVQGWEVYEKSVQFLLNFVVT